MTLLRTIVAAEWLVAVAAALLVGDLPRAQRHLAALKSICVLPCEEYDDLKAAVEAYPRAKLR